MREQHEIGQALTFANVTSKDMEVTEPSVNAFEV